VGAEEVMLTKWITREMIEEMEEMETPKHGKSTAGI